MSTIGRTIALLLLLSFSASCVSHSLASDFHGVNGMRGVPIEYQTTTSWGLHGLWIFPLWGNAKKDFTVGEFTKEAAANGATRTRITRVSKFTYWFILPPLSFFIPPVRTTVEGEIEQES